MQRRTSRLAACVPAVLAGRPARAPRLAGGRAAPLRRAGRLLQRRVRRPPAGPDGAAAVHAVDRQLPAPHRRGDRRAAHRRHLRRRGHRRLLRAAVRRRRPAARRGGRERRAGHHDHRRQRQRRLHQLDRPVRRRRPVDRRSGQPLQGPVRVVVRGHHPEHDLPVAGERAGGGPGRGAERRGGHPGLPVDPADVRWLLRPDAGRRGRRALPAEPPDDAERRRPAVPPRPPAPPTWT